MKWVKNKVSSGYHPYIEAQAPKVEHTLSTALDFALANCHVSESTYKGYRLTVGYLKAAAATIKLDSVLIKAISRKNIKQLLQQCRKERTWSDGAFNKYLGYLKPLLSVLVEWEEIKNNPAHLIKTFKLEETHKFVPYTVEEKKRIREHLYLNDYKFFIYTMVIYHTGLRPMEVLALKVKDIHFTDCAIKLMPDRQRNNSKTKKRREVPINDFLHRFLREHLEGYNDPELYVFGSPFESGKGNRGAGLPGDMFKASHIRIKRDTVTKRWKRIVKDTLGIDKYLYAAKHTGADDKIMAGIDIKALQGMYGHASAQMTEKYITQLKGIHQKQIKDLSPDF